MQETLCGQLLAAELFLHVLKQGRGADRHDSFRKQSLDRAARPSAGAERDGKVGVIAHSVEVLLRRRNANVELRHEAAQLGKPGQKPVGGKAEIGGKGQGTAPAARPYVRHAGANAVQTLEYCLEQAGSVLVSSTPRCKRLKAACRGLLQGR